MWGLFRAVRHMDYGAPNHACTSAMLYGKNLDARPDLQSFQAGLDGHIFEQPAYRTSAIECALRSAQYFKPFEIERQQVECESLGAVVNAARSDRRIVKIHADGGTWPDRRDAAQRQGRATRRTRVVDLQARHVHGVIGQLRRTALLHL